MSGACCVDPGAKQTHTAQGHEETLAGVKAYKTGEGKSAIVIFTDVFGFSFINVRKVADNYAKHTKTTVLIPDLFNGDAMNPDDPNLWGNLPARLGKHPPADTCALGEKILSVIAENYTSIQLVGFCYGAKPVVQLLTHPQLSSKIKAAVVAHPSLLVKEEASQIKRPILFQCAQKDDMFTPELREHFQKELATSGLGKFIDYPDTTHGFAVRPDGSPKCETQHVKAMHDASEFMQKNV